jgi:hypothetical protein
MRLPPNSMANFKELRKMFLMEFLVFRTRKKPSGYLLRLHQPTAKIIRGPWLGST